MILTFVLNYSIIRLLTLFAVIIMPNEAMLNVLTLAIWLTPVASIVPGLQRDVIFTAAVDI